MNGNTIFIAIIMLVLGFGAGFALRPVIAPATEDVHPASVPPALSEPRGVQYFASHLDEAKQIITQCANGSVRGGECSNAEQAVVEAEGKQRFDNFMGR